MTHKSDITQVLTPRDKVERLLRSARAILLAERENLSNKATEFKTGELHDPGTMIEYESVLEELNRYQYTAEMLDMLMKYF